MSYRTVEGNLGLRISAVGVIDSVDSRLILEKRNLNTAEMVEEFEEYCEMVEENPSHLASTEKEVLFDTLLAETAVEVALKRHAGRYASEADAFKGYITGMPMGRDLRNVDLVIGVGGIFSHNDEEKSKAIIKEALKDTNMSLLPKNPKVIIDRDYLLFAAGNIMEQDEDYAMEVLKRKFLANKTN